LQRPMASPTGRVSTGQLDQFLLDAPSNLDFIWACRL
jgi:hypothetical protein